MISSISFVIIIIIFLKTLNAAKINAIHRSLLLSSAKSKETATMTQQILSSSHSNFMVNLPPLGIQLKKYNKSYQQEKH